MQNYEGSSSDRRFTLPEALNIFPAARLILSYSHRYEPNVDATFNKLSAISPQALTKQVRKTMDGMLLSRG